MYIKLFFYISSIFIQNFNLNGFYFVMLDLFKVATIKSRQSARSFIEFIEDNSQRNHAKATEKLDGSKNSVTGLLIVSVDDVDVDVVVDEDV